MNQPPTIQPPPPTPMILGYAAMPRRKNGFWLGIQYIVSMILAVLGPAVLISYAIVLATMNKREAQTQSELVFGVTMVLTFALPAISFAIWLRQRVLRQQAALEPSAPMGRWFDTLYAMAPWCLIVSGAVILCMVGASFATAELREVKFLAQPLYVSSAVAMATLGSGLGMILTRLLAARRLAAQRIAFVPVASVAARPVAEDKER